MRPATSERRRWDPHAGRRGQILTFLVAIEPSREVAVAGIREHGDDDHLAKRLGQTPHRPERRAARMADEQSFGACKRAGQVIRRFCRAAPHLIRGRGIPDPRHDRGRQVLQAFQAVERVLWLDGDRPDRGVVLFQAPCRAHERAGRAKAGDEMSDSTRRLLEDLDRRAFVVSPRVGGVRVLVGIEVSAGIARNDFADHLNGAIRSLTGIAVHDLGPERSDQRLALHADVARHHELDPVAFRRTDQGVCDAGVTGSGVDDGPLAGQRSAPLAVFDHRQGCAIFHRPAGVEPFGLGVNLDAWKRALEEPHAQKRRVADEAGDAGGADVSHAQERIGSLTRPDPAYTSRVTLTMNRWKGLSRRSGRRWCPRARRSPRPSTRSASAGKRSRLRAKGCSGSPWRSANHRRAARPSPTWSEPRSAGSRWPAQPRTAEAGCRPPRYSERAWVKSAMISAPSSIPTETRTVPGPTPSSVRSAWLIER